jgi:hypothetical protein
MTTLTDQQLHTLEAEAGAAGDLVTAATAQIALTGEVSEATIALLNAPERAAVAVITQGEARRACAAVIEEAEALRAED